MYYRHAALKFECTGCGRCCHGDQDSYIALTDAEAVRIRAYLGLSAVWFRRRYLVNLPGMGRGVRIEDDGRCTLLGNDLKCRVYPVRPVQCRTYPFWPELVHTRAAWDKEARCCEGIGRGKTVARETIEAQLLLVEAADSGELSA